MTRQPRRPRAGREDIDPNVPAQQSETEIIEAVGAEQNEEGHLVASEDDVRKLGAVDIASARENARMKDYESKKKANAKNVTFSTDDLLEKYEAIIASGWPPNTLDIIMRRTTGTAVMHTITSRPRSGGELYEALKTHHGQCGEAEYEVKFFDVNSRQYRGIGRITLPSTLPATPHQGQPYYQQQPQVAAQPVSPVQAPQQPPVVVHAPGGPDMSQMFSGMQQMFEMVRTLQTMMQPPPQPQMSPPPPPPQMPPMPPPPSGNDPNAMLAWMQQATEMIRVMQTMQQPAAAHPQPAPAPIGAPPGMVTVPLEVLLQAARGQQPPQRNPFQRGDLPPPRREYSRDEYQPPRGEYPPSRGYSGPPARHIPPDPPSSFRDNFREAIGTFRDMQNMMSEIQSLTGSGEESRGGYSRDGEDEEDESPVRVMDTGAAKIVLDKKNGNIRLAETAWANMDKVAKFVGEQSEAWQRSQERRARAPQQLPPGMVEVHPGYVPPRGYVAVPVDPNERPVYGPPAEEQEPLPPVPEDLPPPVRSAPWAMPTIPEGNS